MFSFKGGFALLFGGFNGAAGITEVYHAVGAEFFFEGNEFAAGEAIEEHGVGKGLGLEGFRTFEESV